MTNILDALGSATGIAGQVQQGVQSAEQGLAGAFVVMAFELALIIFLLIKIAGKLR